MTIKPKPIFYRFKNGNLLNIMHISTIKYDNGEIKFYISASDEGMDVLEKENITLEEYEAFLKLIEKAEWIIN